MVCKNVPAGVPVWENNMVNQREVIDEQYIKKVEVRLPFSAQETFEKGRRLKQKTLCINDM